MSPIFHQWATHLWTAIVEHCAQKNIPIDDFPREVDITPWQWRMIGQQRLFGYQNDTVAYAKIHSVTGIPESDPTTIPPPLTWTNEQYTKWVQEHLKGVRAAMQQPQTLDQWATILWQAIQQFCQGRLMVDSFQSTYDIEPWKWSTIKRSKVLTRKEDTVVYATIFRDVRIKEADPRTLPLPLTWTEEEYQQWNTAFPRQDREAVQADLHGRISDPSASPQYQNRSRSVIDPDANPLSVPQAPEGAPDASEEIPVENTKKEQEKNTWALDLAAAIKAFCRSHGLVPRELARKLGVSQNHWQRISAGTSIVSDPYVYAKYYLFTDLEEANPRRIPDRVYSTFGNVTSRSQSLTEGEWLDWIQTSEAKGIVTLKAELLRPSGEKTKVLPEETPAQQPVEGDEMQFMTGMAAFLQKRVVDAVMSRITDELMAQTQLTAEAISEAVSQALSLTNESVVTQLQQVVNTQQAATEAQRETVSRLEQLVTLVEQVHEREEKLIEAVQSRASPEKLDNDLLHLMKEVGGELRKLAGLNTERRDAVFTPDLVRLMQGIWPWFDAMSLPREEREKKLRFMLDDSPIIPTRRRQ